LNHPTFSYAFPDVDNYSVMRTLALQRGEVDNEKNFISIKYPVHCH
jgi:hypothetical protein